VPGVCDEAAIAACMDVDLNPIRAGLAATPEDSDFTSIQERIRSWLDETQVSVSAPVSDAHEIRPSSLHTPIPMPEIAGQAIDPVPKPVSSVGNSLDATPASWLCPISPEFHRRGILITRRYDLG
jgi:hypothetical protein